MPKTFLLAFVIFDTVRRWVVVLWKDFTVSLFTNRKLLKARFYWAKSVSPIVPCWHKHAVFLARRKSVLDSRVFWGHANRSANSKVDWHQCSFNRSQSNFERSFFIIKVEITVFRNGKPPLNRFFWLILWLLHSTTRRRSLVCSRHDSNRTTVNNKKVSVLSTPSQHNTRWQRNYTIHRNRSDST